MGEVCEGERFSVVPVVIFFSVENNHAACISAGVFLVLGRLYAEVT